MNHHFSKLAPTYRWIIQPLLVVAILLFGFFGAMGLSMFKEEPQVTERKIYAPLVKTLTIRIDDKTLVVQGNGTIVPRVRINIVPQVGGRIVRVHRGLRAGGRFKANEVLLEVERIDYQLAVTRAKAEVLAARKIFEVEAAQATVSKQEWFTLHPKDAIPPIVAREPQIVEARANIEAAQARLQQANLDLQRTRIRMPFSGRVVSSSVDVGEVVVANQSVGIVYANELLEIPVPMELDDLAWISMPGSSSDLASPATVMVSLAGQSYRLAGRVDRVESELDTLSRMVRVVVTLSSKDIPEALRDKVIPGLFVDVAITTQQLMGISVIPMSVLRENGILWTVDKQRLRFVTPQIIYRSESELYIRGLPAGTPIVASQLDVVTDGMQIRTLESPQ